MFGLLLKQKRGQSGGELFNPAKIIYEMDSKPAKVGVSKEEKLETIKTGSEQGNQGKFIPPSAPTTVSGKLRVYSQIDMAMPYELTKHNSMHPELLEIYKRLPVELQELNHLLFFGQSGVGKEYQARYVISKYSTTNLLAERKIVLAPHTKNEFWAKSSDIHYEIDFQHLGCRAISAWNDFFEHVRELTITKPNRNTIILIKNFQTIPYELLIVFHSYLHLCNRGCCIRIIGLTETVSHLPEDILDQFEIIPVERPSEITYEKFGVVFKPTDTPRKIENIRRFYIKNKLPHRNFIYDMVIELANNMVNLLISDEPDIYQIRELLYQIPIQLIPIENVFWEVFKELHKRNIILEEEMNELWEIYYEYANHHNHHYRYIYHVEFFAVNLMKFVRNKITKQKISI